MDDQAGDKSQDPTPHRRQKAREEGQFAKSQDLAASVLLLGGLVMLLTLGGGFVTAYSAYARRQLGGDAWLDADARFITGEWNYFLGRFATVLAPFFLALVVIAVVMHLLQTGIVFLPDKLAPDLKRVDPLKGLGRMFSLPSVMRLVFGLFKIAIVCAVALVSLYAEWPKILALGGQPVPTIAAFVTEVLLWTAIKIAVVLLILALLDYAFQWWKQEQDLKMTTQEVREEMKNLQGDPQTAARRRSVQRQLVLNRLASAVPKADVVVTNPTELAIAIQYDPETMQAPIVVAKGAGVIAQRIRRLALENGIPIVERKPLAQALYKHVEISHPVPQDTYTAVAEVLAYVYQLKGKKAPTPPRAA
ncbi:MAG: EscU/YscU/HrcU family type III secretion system export apparatus switch protein [Planctomycetales bacterium]|nr:EscU/YscU/HrcU family type III secretion system export apparatus switch protein [Planctomycetales bacterium]